MITEFILFDLPAGISKDEVVQGMHDVVPRWRGRAALIRKTFVYDAAANQAGAFYRWQNLEAAQFAHDDAWRQGIRRKYGSEPVIRYFATPLVVDNTLGPAIASAASA